MLLSLVFSSSVPCLSLPFSIQGHPPCPRWNSLLASSSPVLSPSFASSLPFALSSCLLQFLLFVYFDLSRRPLVLLRRLALRQVESVRQSLLAVVPRDHAAILQLRHPWVRVHEFGRGGGLLVGAMSRPFHLEFEGNYR